MGRDDAATGVLTERFVHDLKSPLSALASNLAYLDRVLAAGDAEVCAALRDSALAVADLLFLADNLAAVARLEAGETRPARPTSPAECLAASVDRVRRLSAARPVSIGMDGVAPESACTWVVGWACLALDNLLLCAVRHAPPGTPVTVSASSGSGVVRIAILDHGPVVSPEAAPALLTPAGQASASTTPGARYGRGLGLYAAGLAAHALGGGIRFGARDGRCEAVLTLPIV
jgi:two-component system, sensor histidine kinase and response regulator